MDLRYWRQEYTLHLKPGAMITKTTFPIYQNPDSDGSSFVWPGSKETGIVCLHGFTATTVEVRTFAEGLRRAGYSVAGPLLPGHGDTPAALNKATWKDWYAAASSSFLQMQGQCKNVFLAGESMGALLSLLLAAEYPQIKGLLLFSPALIIPGLWKSLFIWPFKAYSNKKNINLDSPWQGYNVVPVHAASELWKLQSRARRILHKVQTPAIVFQGKLDRTINPLSSEIVLKNIGSDDTQLVWLEEAPHVILLEGPVQQVVEISLDFVASHT